MRLHLLAVLGALLSAPVLAAETGATGDAARLGIELNALEAQEGACRLIFVAENQTDADLSALVLEAVLFDREGRVAALTLLDFRDLPAGRTRVRPFDMAGIDCDALDRVLINDVAACETEAATAACGDLLAVSSRTDIELLQ